MNLFNYGEFTLSAGGTSRFKIDCDALAQADIDSIAKIVHEIASPFGDVVGVPTGGFRLANALDQYAQPNVTKRVLIVDDVYTTGASIERARRFLMDDRQLPEHLFVGYVIFARHICPPWIKSIFTLEVAL